MSKRKTLPSSLDSLLANQKPKEAKEEIEEVEEAPVVQVPPEPEPKPRSPVRARAQRPAPRKQPKKKPNKTKLVRASYDVLPELRDAVSERARIIGIPNSQLAAFLLSDGLRRLDDGEISVDEYLVDSTSPKFRYNIRLDDWHI